jgi:drug/metabolite transporter (DMT)-like permease
VARAAFTVHPFNASCAASSAVMLGEIVLAGARPGASKVMSVVVLTFGIGLFMLFKPSKKAGSGDTFDWNVDMAFGCGLVMLALVMDGVYGPYQNKITAEAEEKTGEKLSPYHLMFNMNFYQGVFSLIMVLPPPAVSVTIERSRRLNSFLFGAPPSENL